MEQWNIWLERDLWLNVAIVVVATALIYSVLRTLVNTLHKRLKAWSKDQDGSWPHFVAMVIGRTSRVLLLAFSLLLALRLPELPGSWHSALSHTWFVALALQVALWVDTGVRLWSRSLVMGKNGGSYNPVMTTIISIMILIVVWSVMLLSILANLGGGYHRAGGQPGCRRYRRGAGGADRAQRCVRLAVDWRRQALRNWRLRGVRRSRRDHRAYRPEDHAYPQPQR